MATDAAARKLLFGLIALQNGLIDKDQRVRTPLRMRYASRCRCSAFSRAWIS